MPGDLSPAAIVTLNALGLPSLQLGLAWLFGRLPVAWFEGEAETAAPPGFLLIGKWKHLLPDGSAWFAGGFAKGRLTSRGPDYLRRFLAETRRGEACHWMAIFLCPLFFLWNPPWGGAVIALYALVANLPCILVQRHNRARLLRALARTRKVTAGR